MFFLCCTHVRVPQVVREEQGDGVVDSPPVYPRPVDDSNRFQVTRPYCRGIAYSEPCMQIEGPAYWCELSSRGLFEWQCARGCLCFCGLPSMYCCVVSVSYRS